MTFTAFDPGQNNHRTVVDNREVCRFARLIPKFSKIRQGLCHEIATPDKCRADSEALCADMPHGVIAIELHETSLLERRQQSVNGRRRQTRAHRQIGQAVSLIVLSKRFDDQESTVYTLHAAIPEIGVIIARFRLDKSTPDHVSLHHDLHPVFTRCCKNGSMLLD